MKLQSAGKSAIQAPRTQYFVLAFVAFLVMAVIALQFPLPATAATALNTIYLAQIRQAQPLALIRRCLTCQLLQQFRELGQRRDGYRPGTTVHLCGTITSNLSFQGNGTSGNPVVLDGTGATMSAYITTSSQYWTIQNCTCQPATRRIAGHRQ